MVFKSKTIFLLFILLINAIPQEVNRSKCDFDKIVYTRIAKYDRSEQNFFDFNNGIFATGGFLMEATDLGWFFLRILDALDPTGNRGRHWRVENFYKTLKKILKFYRIDTKSTDPNTLEQLNDFAEIIEKILRHSRLEFEYKNIILIIERLEENVEILDVQYAFLSYDEINFLKGFVKIHYKRLRIVYEYQRQIEIGINERNINNFIEQSGNILFLVNYLFLIGDLVHSYNEVYDDLYFLYNNSPNPEIHEAIFRIISTRNSVINQIIENVSQFSYDYFGSKLIGHVIETVIEEIGNTSFLVTLTFKIVNFFVNDNGDYFLYTYFASEMAKEFHNVVYNYQRNKILSQNIKSHQDLENFARGNRILFLTEAFTYYVMQKSFESMGEDVGLYNRIRDGFFTLQTLGIIQRPNDFFDDFERIMAYASGQTMAFSENSYDQFRLISQFNNFPYLMNGFDISQNDINNNTQNITFESCTSFTIPTIEPPIPELTDACDSLPNLTPHLLEIICQIGRRYRSGELNDDSEIIERIRNLARCYFQNGRLEEWERINEAIQGNCN